jgi:hypothetical protein
MNRGRTALALALILAGLLPAACRGNEASPVPVLGCDDTAPAPNVVTLRCAAVQGTDTWILEAVIGGPSNSAITGFYFDVVFDPGVLEYVSNSAQAGSLLTQDGTPVSVAAVPMTGDPGRLVVGVHRQGTGPGVPAGIGINVIMRFRLRTPLSSTFGPVMPALEKGAAVNLETGEDPIIGITFNDQLLLFRR